MTDDVIVRICFYFSVLATFFVFLSDCTQLRLARLSSFTASDDRGLGLYDPNGKQLTEEYLNILPKIYSLVHWNLGHRWHIRGKTDPNSMTSVGHCPKLGPSSRLLRLWFVTVQTSSVLIGLLWNTQEGTFWFPVTDRTWLMSSPPQTFLSESNWKQHKSFYFWIILSVSESSSE